MRWLGACSIVVLTVMVGACRPSKPPTHAPATVRPATREQILAGSGLPPVLEAPIAGDPMAVTVHRLSNGLTVYVSTDRQAPSVSAWIVVRAGSRDDPADSTGLAHYLEHMLFKGTDELGTVDIEAERRHLRAIEALYDELREAKTARRAALMLEIDRATQKASAYAIPNEIDRLYASLGIKGVDAFTGPEETTFVAEVPSHRLAAWAQVEGERFADPVFRLFFPELEIVYQEKNRFLADPETRLEETLQRALFPAHPYGTQPTIGRVEHLEVPAYAEMKRFFFRHYVPNNMAIVLAGDIGAETAVSALERGLGRLEPRSLRPRDPIAVGRPDGRVFRQLEAAADAKVVVAWSTESATNPAEPVIHVLDWLMDNEQSGIINAELELPQKVLDAGSFAQFYREAGYWAIWATARDGQSLAEVEQQLLAVVDRLKAGQFTQADVDTVVLHERIRRKREIESNSGRATIMSSSFVFGRSWAQVLERDQRLAAVTKQDVVSAANEILGADRVVVYRERGTPRIAKIHKPRITPLTIDAGRESEFSRRVRALEAVDPRAEQLVAGQHYAKLDLPAGPLISTVNRRNDLFTVAYHFERGYRKAPLLCLALELLERSGAGDLPARELKRRLVGLGAQVTTRCNAKESSITLTGIDSNLEASVALVKRWIRAPAFDDASVATLRVNTLTRRQNQLDDGRVVGVALRDWAFFGRRSAWLAHARNRQVQRASSRQFRRLIVDLPSYRHRTLYYGPRAAQAVASVLPLGVGKRGVGAVAPRRYRNDRRSRIYFVHRERSNAVVNLILPAGVLPAARRPHARVLTEYYSGSLSGVAAQEIREARGLAYYVTASYSRGTLAEDETGLMARLETQPEKTVEALRVLLEILRAHDVKQDRFDVARIALVRRYLANRIAPRSLPLRALLWELQGEPGDPRVRERAAVESMTANELSEFLHATAQGPFFVSVMGDRDRIDLEALAKIAPVVELRARDLFNYGSFPK